MQFSFTCAKTGWLDQNSPFTVRSTLRSLFIREVYFPKRAVNGRDDANRGALHVVSGGVAVMHIGRHHDTRLHDETY